MATADLMREIEATIRQAKEVLVKTHEITQDGTLRRVADGVPVVCMVGSSRFKARFAEIGERLEKAGVLALTMSFFQHADGRPVSPEEREALRKVDRARIDLAEEVWVVNDERMWCPKCDAWKDYAHWSFGGGMGRQVCTLQGCYCTLQRRPYVGEDTGMEIKYAQERGKTLRWLNPGPGQLPFDVGALRATEDQTPQRGGAMADEERKGGEIRGYTNFPTRTTEGGVIVPVEQAPPEGQATPPREPLPYEHGHGVRYDSGDMPRAYLSVPVLSFLTGRKWDRFALAFLHSVRPSAVRVIPYGHGEKTDGWLWRVTVRLNKDETIRNIEQECEVYCEGFAHGHDLYCKFLKDGGKLA